MKTTRDLNDARVDTKLNFNKHLNDIISKAS